jgi:hypothetical protein
MISSNTIWLWPSVGRQASDLGPSVLSTHLPPAIGQTAQFLDMLAAAPDPDPFVGPDQHALEEMLAGFEPRTAAS